jgi:hypothetical protein
LKVLYSAVDCTLVFEKDMPTGVWGVVTNISTSNCDPIRGVTVSIGAVQDTTDSDGAYLLLNVPYGAQQIVLNAMGFDTFTDAVNISNGHITPKNIGITPIAAIYGIITE